MRIIEIYLNENQSHSCTRNIFYAGRKYDSNNTAVKFTNKNLLIDGWNFYLKVDKEDEVTEIPLLQNLFIIGENLTQTAGILTCTLIGRNSNDNSTKTFEPFRLKIEDVEYDQDDKEQQPMDSNMKLLYEQLIKLKENLEQQEFSSLPTGGSTDQVLSKASDEDYDFKWRSVENQTGPSSSITEDELDKIWDEKIT
jgi:hypothetical protein